MIGNVTNIVTYARIYLGTIEFSYNGTLKPHTTLMGGRNVRNKVAVLSKGDFKSIREIMENRCRSYVWCGSSLYISSDVKMPRDVIRKSYAIKREPEKAEYTIIPYLERNLTHFEYDVAFFDESANSLYLYTVERHGTDTVEVSPERKDAIMKAFPSRVCLSDDVTPQHVQLVPICQEYFDLIRKTYPDRKYVFEDKIEIENPPAKFSVENLLLWEKIEESNLLRKTILNSDWRDYPITLCAFLIASDHKYINQCNDLAFKNVMRQIRYDSSFSLIDLIKGTDVTPKDWNLLQEYVLAKCGIREDKGFVDADTYRAAGDLRVLLPKKIAVKAMKINEPMLTDNLVELLNK